MCAQAAPTAYKSQQGRGDFYRLDSLVFFARNRARNLGDLVKASRAAGVQFHTQDRKVLCWREASQSCWLPAEPWWGRAAQLHNRAPAVVRDLVKVLRAALHCARGFPKLLVASRALVGKGCAAAQQSASSCKGPCQEVARCPAFCTQDRRACPDGAQEMGCPLCAAASCAAVRLSLLRL